VEWNSTKKFSCRVDFTYKQKKETSKIRFQHGKPHTLSSTSSHLQITYNPFLLEDLNWGEDFFTQLRIPTAVYMAFFPNEETQILFSGFDDTPSILYHGPELINIDLLSTLPWLNKYQ